MMCSIVALRCLEKFTKHGTTAIKCYGNLLKPPLVITPVTQCVTTKVTISSKNSREINNNKWRIVYRLPLIRLASAFNSVKVPFGMVNGIVIAAAGALEQASMIPPSTTILAGAIGITSFCTLSICSLFIKNLIGIIYINDNNDKLRLAYVDYWGKRQDVCIQLDDLILEENSKPAQFHFYQSVRLYSRKKVKYILLPKYGSIEDPEIFCSIFGE